MPEDARTQGSCDYPASSTEVLQQNIMGPSLDSEPDHCGGRCCGGPPAPNTAPVTASQPAGSRMAYNVSGYGSGAIGGSCCAESPDESANAGDCSCCEKPDPGSRDAGQESSAKDCQAKPCCADKASQDATTQECADDSNCCTGENEVSDTESLDECCASQKPPTSTDNTCCSGPGCSAEVEATAPPCFTCIERLALRDCKQNCSDESHTTGGSDNGVEPDACSTHRTTAFERYSEKLATLGCLCRALIAKGQESCCVAKPAFLKPRGRGKGDPAASSQTAGRRGRSAPSTEDNQYCRSDVAPIQAQGSGCKTACCTPSSPISKGGCEKEAVVTNNDTPVGLRQNLAASQPRDPEKGHTGREHVALTIAGMTCTGCETKLQRVLGNLPAVTNLQTSLVMARTEFVLDNAVMSVDAVMKHVERTTEFKCQEISTQGSSLEVIPKGDMKEFLDQAIPIGVNYLQRSDNDSDIVQVNFDPRVVGARDLCEKQLLPSALGPFGTDPGLAAGSKHVKMTGYYTLLSCILTIPVLVLAWAPLPEHDIAYGAASLVLATIVQLVVAGPFYPKALKSLIFSRMIEMDLLIVLSTSAAYIFSVVSFGFLVRRQPLSTGEFFETSTLLVSLVMVGRFVGALARQKAVESISIRSLQSSTALLVNEDGITSSEIDTRLLQYGDSFIVLPEHRIPTDGIVTQGESETDEAMVTGESRPVEKTVGDHVLAGSINGSGKLMVRLTHLPADNTVSVIAGMIDSAKLTKPKVQAVADRIASYFVPVVVALTIITFAVWVAVGIEVRRQGSSEASIQALTFAITVLIVSCPCAIGLAVPMVIVIGTGVAADYGIIFKSADSIETVRSATHVVFDKTGTLTEGKLKVQNEYYSPGDSQARSAVLGLVAGSKHPVSAAVGEYLKEQAVTERLIADSKAIPGHGIEGTVGGRTVRGGNAHWLQVASNNHVADMLSNGYTVFCVTIDSKLCAAYALSDTLRPDAHQVVSQLKKKGIQVSILSGDDDGAVQSVAEELGLDPSEAHSKCRPADKLEFIKKLQSGTLDGKSPTIVFVGDGTNDAGALAQANIGVHVNSGTDIAQSAADVVLMRPTLHGVATMIDISRASMVRIMFNFGWSAVYNVLALLFASGALVAANGGAGVRIPPEYAGLGELVSVLPVIVIALTLKWVKF
ncbi:hypothetical protein JX265_010572 [Neoarthrinium moseri]|uniref:Uncharacterized protein n=1 Tax=Neoarthrinium moseri TaxID=1658444 RepID=A0A9P9WDU2_9PEZI|nr:hypothetical protein JX266_007720 [Neoarthrinium moseri]KAI1859095.1 hypothetical protein JX265_010572 [Neoarthrinium moseri]